MVFRDGALIALIDLDFASPGPRVWDVAYLAYRLIPLTVDSLGQAESEPERRIGLLLEAYGAEFDATELLQVAAARLDDLAEFTEQRALETGNDGFLQHAVLYRRDAVALRGR